MRMILKCTKITRFQSVTAKSILIIAILLSLVISASCANEAVVPAGKQKIIVPELAQSVAIPGSSIASGTLNLYGNDPQTLDPATSSDAGSHSYIMQLYSGLVYLDNSMKPTADIAQSCKVSDDGKIYTFTLRPDVKFHDGKPVKAENFKYSWERACNPATKSLSAREILGDISGAREMLDGKAVEIKGVKAIDDYTLQVTLDEPRMYFYYKLAHPVAFVIDMVNLEAGDNWWNKPNGTGPFRLGKWEKGNFLILNRNNNYYAEPAKVESVNFHILAGIPMDMYERDEIDITSVNLNYIDRVMDETSPFNKQLTVIQNLNIQYITYNSKTAPFDDVNVRLAFSHAIDRNKLSTKLFRNMYPTATGILPPGLPGYNDNITGLDFNIEKAKELIAKSKYAGSMPPIILTVFGRGGQIGSLETALIDQWQQNLGIKVKVRQIEPERYPYLKQEKDNILVSSWVADYPHPQNFLTDLFSTDAEHNFSEFNDSEIDALLQKASQEPDTKLSMIKYQQAEQMLINKAACFPLMFGKTYVLIKPYVKGYVINSQGMVRLNTVSIESH